MKIANKINLSFLITALVLTAISVPIFYLISKNKLEQSILSQLSIVAESRANHIICYLESSKEAILQLSKSVAIKRLLMTDKSDRDYQQRFDDVMVRLKDTSEVARYVFGMCVVDKRGIVIASTAVEEIGRDKSKNKFFLGAKKDVFIKDVYICALGEQKSLGFSAPIRGENNRLLGVVYMRFLMSAIDRITANRTGLGKTGEMYLINKSGLMITPSYFKKNTLLKLRVDTENIKKCFEDFKKISAKPYKHRPITYKDYRGIKVLGAYVPICQMQWYLLAKIDQKEIFVPLARIKIVFFILMVFVPSAGYLIGSFISKAIAGPIHRLHKGTEVIGQGNLDYKTNVRTKDEIGQLSMAFDKMTEDLKKTTTSIINLNDEIVIRKQAEKKIKQMAEEWEITFNSITDLISIQDKDFRIIKVNKAYADTLKMKPEEIIGKACYEVFHRAKGPWPNCPHKQVLCTKKPAVMEFFEPSLGTYFENSVSPIFNEEGEVIGSVHIAKDITKRKRTEQALQDAYQELKKTQQQLVQSSKMAAMGQLAAGISHELNQPLTGIKGFAQAVCMDIDESSPLKEDLNKIIGQADRMDKIIKNIRFFSRKSQFILKEIDISQPIEDALMLLSEQLRVHNIRLEKSLTNELPQIQADPNQLQQAFLNLITNARDAIDNLKRPEGGKLTIRSLLSEDKKHIEITFGDNGTGISKQNLEHIFNPFFTTKSPDGGMGIGLSIVYRIIEEHKGRIEVESEEGKGTRLKIELPIAVRG